MQNTIKTFGHLKAYSGNGYVTALPGETIKPFISSLPGATEGTVNNDFHTYFDKYSTVGNAVHFQALLLLLVWFLAGIRAFKSAGLNETNLKRKDGGDIDTIGTNNNILLVDFSCSRGGIVNKDVNAGLGTRTRIGSSLRARILENIKSRGVKLPLIDLAYISAILKKKGYHVGYCNVKSTSGVNDLYQIIRDKSISIAIFNPALVSYKEEKEIAAKVKHSFPDTTIGAIGAMAIQCPEVLIDSFDWVLVCEADSYLHSNGIESLKGIIKEEYRLKDLDQLPFPDWSIYGQPNGFSYKPMIKETPFLTVQGSKGCPMACKYYCPYPAKQGTEFRVRSVSSLIEEIKELHEKYDARSILFRDPFFSLSKKRTRDFANALVENRIHITWACETRLESLDEGLLRLLFKSGLRSINVGIESHDAFILKDAKRKGVDPSREKELIGFCDRLGIKINAFFIIGLMKDSRESILKMIEYAKSLRTFSTQFTVNTPLPGTPFFDDMKEYLVDKNLEHYDNNTLVFNHPNLTKEDVADLKEKAFIDYYFRITFILRCFRWKIRDLFS